ncbi:hypothetical protein CUREO10432_08955, partial [Campylobacter ureolyticus]
MVNIYFTSGGTGHYLTSSNNKTEVKLSSWDDDEIVEDDSKFKVRITNWSSNTTVLGSNEKRLTIYDDD